MGKHSTSLKYNVFYMDIELSDKDLMRLLDGKANLVTYRDISKYKNIDQLLGKYDACIILFEWKPDNGHWCCIFKNKDGSITFFDPYSSFPDDNLKHVPKNFRNESKQNMPYLSELLLAYPGQLTYNDFDFQAHKPNIATCGRHVAFRLLYRYLDDDHYIDFIKKQCKKEGLTPDQLVTKYTM